MGRAATRDAHLPSEHFVYAYNASKRTKCCIKRRKRANRVFVSHSAARQNRPVLLGLRASMAKDRLRPAECNRKGTSVLHCGRQR
jgi:hypothetical protein